VTATAVVYEKADGVWMLQAKTGDRRHFGPDFGVQVNPDDRQAWDELLAQARLRRETEWVRQGDDAWRAEVTEGRGH
jgi:hypothetical protein